MRFWIVLTAVLLVVHAAAAETCVDINAASRDELMRIVRIDEVRSAEALELRARRPFADVRDLTRIRGIGPSRILDIEAQGLACVGGVAPAGTRPEISGIVRAIDGDTLEIADERVRLIGIDAPESDQTCLDDDREWRCGELATATLDGLTEGSGVGARVYGRDVYHRALAVCYRGEVDLNGVMVRSGQALAWYPTGSGAVVEPSYVAEQREAQQSRAGIWRGDVASPLEWRR